MEVKSIRRLLPYTIVIILFLLALVILFNNTSFMQKANNQNQQAIFLQAEVTEESFPSYLAMNQIIQDLPKNAEISLKTTDKEYVITRGKVEESKAKNPDISIFLPSKYLSEFSNGFCSTIDKANKNRDLEFVFHSSEASLAWKYKSLFKYKSCFGL